MIEARLRRLAPISAVDASLLQTILQRSKLRFVEGSRIVPQGGELQPRLLVSGWAAEHRTFKDGRRQIATFLLPGDIIGLSRRAGALAMASICAITDVVVVDAAELGAACRSEADHPLTNALMATTAEREYFLIGQAIRLGRQSAYERMAHLLCELDYRLAARGMADNHGFLLPLTQETLADAVGLSVVHVNRTLQQMRREALIELSRGKLTILKPEILREISEFTPPDTGR